MNKSLLIALTMLLLGISTVLATAWIRSSDYSDDFEDRNYLINPPWSTPFEGCGWGTPWYPNPRTALFCDGGFGFSSRGRVYQPDINVFNTSLYEFKIDTKFYCDSKTNMGGAKAMNANCTPIELGNNCSPDYCVEGYVLTAYIDLGNGSHGKDNNCGFGLDRINRSGVRTTLWMDQDWMCDQTWNGIECSDCEHWVNLTLERDRLGDITLTAKSTQGIPGPVVKYIGNDKTYSNLVLDSVQIGAPKYEALSPYSTPDIWVDWIDYFYACGEDWQLAIVNGSCLVDDTRYIFKEYYDAFNCNTSDFLPEDNGTIIGSGSCNFCSEDINRYVTAEGCVGVESITTYFIDHNYDICCGMTGLLSDCHIDNGTYDNQTQQCIKGEGGGSERWPLEKAPEVFWRDVPVTGRVIAPPSRDQNFFDKVDMFLTWETLLSYPKKAAGVVTDALTTHPKELFSLLGLFLLLLFLNKEQKKKRGRRR